MHRKFVLLSLGFVIAALPVIAQEGDGWKLKSVTGLQLTQSSFSQSWQGDEVGTVSWVTTWNSEAQNQLAPWANWLNTLQLQFGQTHRQDPDRRTWQSPSKSVDKITYRGIVRYTFGAFVDPYTALDIDSQFFQRREGIGTRLLTPTRISESAGVARAFWDTERRRLVSRLGFAVRENIDRFAIDPVSSSIETETTTDGGIEWFTDWRIAAEKDRTVYKSELRLFKPVATSLDAGKRLHWPAVDLDWQNTVTNKLTSWLAWELFWQVRYDKQVDLRGQFKQTAGFGLTWQLL